MIIASWNINSIRIRTQQVVDYLFKKKIDILVLQEIKTKNISPEQLEEMHSLSGSYEDLFSKRAQLYKSRGLKDIALTEEDFKNLILETYTFLKRPVAIINGEIFIGNSKKNVEALQNVLK